MIETTSGVYKITNLLNDKIYIGSSRNIYKRWQAHKSKIALGESVFSNEINSMNDVKFELIEIVKPENLEERETYYIESYKACDPKYGYNLNSLAFIAKQSKKVYRKRIDPTVNPIIWSGMQKLAEKRQTSVSGLLDEAMTDLLKKHGANVDD